MKYIEKLRKEHPECVSDEYSGGCIGCPHERLPAAGVLGAASER